MKSGFNLSRLAWPPSRPLVQQLLLCGLVLVWSIPGTIGLRNLFIVLLALTVNWSPLFRRAEWRQMPAPVWALLCLTLAIFLHSLLLSSDPGWSLREFSGQWIKALLLFMIGFLLALQAARSDRADRLLGLIAALLAAPIVWTLVDACWLWWRDGSIPFGVARLTGSRTGTSYLNNLLMAFLVADVLSRLFPSTERRRLLAWPLPWVLAIATLSLFCSWLLSTRNGNIGILFLATSSLLLYVLWQWQVLPKRKLAFICTVGVLALTLFAAVSYKTDPRWSRFMETASVAWDIDHNDAWRKPASDSAVLPNSASGNEVEQSAYLRLTWIHSGLRLTGEYPLGVGYGRNAYGHAMTLYFKQPFSGHSHSGLLDWTLGVGIPGLLLWLGVVALLFRYGWRAWAIHRAPAGLLLIFLVSGFLGRSVLDSNMRDHMMEMAFFLFGLLIASAAASQSENR